MDLLVLTLVLVLVLVPLVKGFDKEPGLLELGLLAKYPEYQAVVRPFKKRNGGGLNFKRNGGVPDECRGKYDTSIYTQVQFSTVTCDVYELLSYTNIAHLILLLEKMQTCKYESAEAMPAEMF